MLESDRAREGMARWPYPVRRGNFVFSYELPLWRYPDRSLWLRAQPQGRLGGIQRSNIRLIYVVGGFETSPRAGLA